MTYVACSPRVWGKIQPCPLQVPYFQGLPTAELGGFAILLSRPVVYALAQDSATLKGLAWKVLRQVNQENY